MNIFPSESSALKFAKADRRKSIHFIAYKRDFILDVERYYPLPNIEVIFRKGLEVSNSSFVSVAGPVFRGSDRLSKTHSEAYGRFGESGHFVGYLLSDDVYFIEQAGVDDNDQLLAKIYRFKDSVYPGCTNVIFDILCEHGFQDVEKHIKKKKQREKRNSEVTKTESNVPNSTVNFRDTFTTFPNKKMILNSAKIMNSIPSGEKLSSYGSDKNENCSSYFEGTSNTACNLTHILVDINKQNFLGNSTDKKISLRPIKVCGVRVEADNSYLKRFSLKQSSMLVDIFLSINFVDMYFRQVEFVKGGDPIAIVLQEIVVYLESKRSIFSVPKPEGVELEEYLSDVSKLRVYDLKKKLCLILVLAHKNVLGGSLGYKLTQTGICQSQSNVIFITSQPNDFMVRISTDIHYLSILVHVAEAFGTNIGHIKHKKCSSKSVFLNSRRGPYPHMLFTECRIANVASIINETGNCLSTENVNSCGNGIKDRFEACDCGPKEICSDIDPCCNSNCELNEGAACSFGDPCCDQNCQISTNESSLSCGKDRSCNPSTCDGLSAQCPDPPEELESKPCLQFLDALDALTCNFGSCDRTMCRQSLLLSPCRCAPESPFECLKCCENDEGVCKVPELKFNLRSYTRQGAMCSNNRICSPDGKCVDVLAAIVNGQSILKAVALPRLALTLFVIAVAVF